MGSRGPDILRSPGQGRKGWLSSWLLLLLLGLCNLINLFSQSRVVGRFCLGFRAFRVLGVDLVYRKPSPILNIGLGGYVLQPIFSKPFWGHLWGTC